MQPNVDEERESVDGFVEQIAGDAFLCFVEFERLEEFECFVEWQEAELREGEFL